MTRMLGFAALLASFACSAATSTSITEIRGTWGGDNAGLIVDKLLIEAQGSVDEATRTGLYRAVQDRIAEDCPWVPIAHSEYVVAVRAELEDVVLSPLGHPVYARIHRRDAR